MKLLDLARRQRWSTLAARAETLESPNEIFEVDENLFTALHWACFNRPDPRAVRAVLAACLRLEEESASTREEDDAASQVRTAAIMGNVALMTDKDEGMTALHAACCSHASIEVIVSLVQHCPATVMMRDRSGWTPLHFTCHTALSVMEEAEANYTIEVARILIDAEPAVVLCEDCHGNSALEVFVSLFGNLAKNDWTYGGGVPAESADQLFWSVCSLLIRKTAVHYRHGHVSLLQSQGDQQLQPQEEVDVPILHQVALMPPLHVSGQLISYMTSKFPNQLKEADTNGNLPLHIAAGVYCIESTSHAGINNNPDMIRALIDAYPAAALSQNSIKQLPLSVAIQSGRSWEGGVKDLLEAHPETLQSCAIKCKLYPFLLSRLAAGSSDGSAQTALFSILRSKPDLLQGCRL